MAKSSQAWQRFRQSKGARLLAESMQRWYAANTFELGAALAYYAVFSISPLVVLAVAIASLFFGRAAAEGRISQEIAFAVGPTMAEAIQATLRYAHRAGSGGTATLLRNYLKS